MGFVYLGRDEDWGGDVEVSYRVKKKNGRVCLGKGEVMLESERI